MNPLIAAGIRKALGQLFEMGADNYGYYWLDELHQPDGYPIKDRWNAMTLGQMQSDISLIAGLTGEKIP